MKIEYKGHEIEIDEDSLAPVVLDKLDTFLAFAGEAAKEMRAPREYLDQLDTVRDNVIEDMNAKEA